MVPVSLAGDSNQDRQLWNTYFSWARSVLDPKRRQELARKAQFRRISRHKAAHLQAIVFAAFALEYRVKRIYKVLGLAHREKDTLGSLLSHFRHRVETAERLDGHGRVQLPAQWKSIEARLRELNRFRNSIAHANYQQVLDFLPNDARRSRAVARRCFNALVDAIHVTNKAIGYETLSESDATRYYRKLKIR